MTRTLALIAASTLALAACGQSSQDAARDNAATDARPPAAADGTATPPNATENGMGSTSGPGGTPDASADNPNESGLAEPGMTGSSPTATVAVRTLSPQDYVNNAVSGDQFEIQASQYILGKTRDPAVTRFAKMMVTDHRASTGALTKAASQANLVAPRFELSAKHQALLDTLRQAGANADQMYLDQQRTAHEEAIALHRSMAEGANVPAPLAKSLLPKVEQHARMLASMKTGTNT